MTTSARNAPSPRVLAFSAATRTASIWVDMTFGPIGMTAAASFLARATQGVLRKLSRWRGETKTKPSAASKSGIIDR